MAIKCTTQLNFKIFLIHENQVKNREARNFIYLYIYKLYWPPQDDEIFVTISSLLTHDFLEIFPAVKYLNIRAYDRFITLHVAQSDW